MTQQSAYADPESDNPDADAVAAVVNAVAPDPVDSSRVDVDVTSSKIVAVGDDLQIAIPTTDAGQVTLSRPGQSADSGLGVGLPTSGRNAEAAVAQDGTVIYDSNLPATDVAVQAFDDGVRIQTVLSDEQAPTRFTYPVEVPIGGKLAVGPDGGVLVTVAEGPPHGGFAPPWAKDSAGTTIPTHYEVHGTDVVQIVEHAGASYPVVADPWLWIDLISNAAWVHHNEGWTLMVADTLGAG